MAKHSTFTVPPNPMGIYTVSIGGGGGNGCSGIVNNGSGITKVSEVREYFFFEGSSGSIYSCRKGCYGANGYGSSVLSGLIEKVEKNGGTMEILPEETNWLEIDYA